MNPEFKRNLWLGFSPQRLVLMPLMLAVIAVLTVVLSDADNSLSNLQNVFSGLGFLLVFAWGGFSVMQNINSEVDDRTWEQQRLSALSPWQMAWGKLLGAPAYAWYGGLMCAAVVLIIGVLSKELSNTFVLVLSAIAAALAAHSGLLASRLHSLDTNKATGSRTVPRLFIAFVFMQILFGLISFMWMRSDDGTSPFLTWWNIEFEPASLLLLMSIFALMLGLLALWRSMSTQLMLRTSPWAWALGCTALGLIGAGFFNENLRLVVWPAIVIGTALTASYFAVFTEKNNALVWRTVVYHACRRNWQRFLQALPLWPVSCLVALVFSLLYSLVFNSPDTIVLDNTPSFESNVSRAALLPIMWMLTLHCLRDMGIYLFFAWRNTTRKPAGMAVLTYFCLGYIFPMLFASSGLALFFEPLTGIDPFKLPENHEGNFITTAAWLAMFVQLFIVALLLVWRWKNTVAKQESPQKTS